MHIQKGRKQWAENVQDFPKKMEVIVLLYIGMQGLEGSWRLVQDIRVLLVFSSQGMRMTQCAEGTETQDQTRTHGENRASDPVWDSRRRRH